ncbi:MAG: host attachment protein [Chlamydiales bacterium]|nr:host attachment protein [Chlamydiales bacterium]
MKNKTWVVVANSSQATVYKAEKLGVLNEVHTLLHPESRLHDRDIVTDKPGRTNPSITIGRSAYEPQTSPKRHEIEVFAKELSEFLEQSREQGLYSKLYIAAAPSFLGLLREKLSQATTRLVAGEVDKDCTHLKPKEICDAVPFMI